MAIADLTLFVLHRFLNDRDEAHGSFLSIGRHGWDVSNAGLKRNAFTGVTKRQNEDYVMAGRQPATSKILIKQSMANLGFAEYLDLDIDPLADFVMDLVTDDPAKIGRKFDVVFDPTSCYTSDPIVAYQKTSDFVRVGGLKIVETNIADMTNRYPLLPSPNFLIDFHCGTGFEIVQCIILGPDYSIKDYPRYYTKATPLPVFLSYTQFVKMILSEIYRGVALKLRAARYKKLENYGVGFSPNEAKAIVDDLGKDSAARQRLKKLFARLGVLDTVKAMLVRPRLLRTKLHWHMRGFLTHSYGYTFYLLLKKRKEADYVPSITQHYRYLTEDSA